MDIIKSWVLQNILSGCAELLQQFLTVFGAIFDNIFVVVAEFNKDIASGVTDFTLPFSIAFIVFLTIKQYFTVYVLETDGDPDADPLDIFLRAAQAIAVAVCCDWIFDFFLQFSSPFTFDLQSNALNTGGQEVSDTLTELLSIPANFQSIPAVIIIIAIGVTVAIIIFGISAGIRGAELILFKMLFPLFACDLLTTSRERWNGFFTSYMVTWLAYGLQLVSFNMFASTLTVFITADTTDFWKLFAIMVGWLLLMLRAPKWLEKFTYTSGLASGVHGAGRSLMYMGMKRR